MLINNPQIPFHCWVVYFVLFVTRSKDNIEYRRLASGTFLWWKILVFNVLAELKKQFVKRRIKTYYQKVERNCTDYRNWINWEAKHVNFHIFTIIFDNKEIVL